MTSFCFGPPNDKTKSCSPPPSFLELKRGMITSVKGRFDLAYPPTIVQKPAEKMWAIDYIW